MRFLAAAAALHLLAISRGFAFSPSSTTTTCAFRCAASSRKKMGAQRAAAEDAVVADSVDVDAPTAPEAAPEAASEEDPYLYLEEVESDRSLEFARKSNAACLASLGDPKSSGTGTYDRLLAALESDERIPHARSYGRTKDGDDEILFNLWKDSKNPKGLWRKTLMSSYKTETPEWTTVVNLDELAEKDGVSWVWKGSRTLPKSWDPMSDGGRITTRTLLNLSRGGADAVHVKEFDLLEEKFVTEEEGGFVLPEAKSRCSYKSRDVLLVGTDTGPGSLTDSGYPRTMREWVRGTKLEDAPVVFEGEKTDVSVYRYVADQTFRNGKIYEVQGRTLTFYTSRKWARIIQHEHLLAPDDPDREAVADPEPFVEVDVQEDASINFVGNLMLISLRSDWEPVEGSGQVFKSGSVLYVDAETFLHKGREHCNFNVLFEPSERTAFETYGLTKNFLILSMMDNVCQKKLVYEIGSDGSTLTHVGGDTAAKTNKRSFSAVDSTDSDDFFLTTSGYTQPSTLSFGKLELSDGGKVGDVESCVTDGNIKSLPHFYDSEGLEVTQKTAVSKDGTKIPYFLVCKKDVELDGNTPTLLYGYGGFEVSLGPKYVASAGIAWLERGGACVEANIRGGGEFGPAWHQAALKENRNKSYEDFIAVAEHLIESGLCTSKSLATRGGSNGGLLMGNMYTMRPDLFGAIHCAVPLLDMRRYHTLLAGASWMAEYGDPDTDDWKFLKKYSPYHNIDESIEYPPLLVTTSTRDDRVHPGHARKFVKKLWDLGKENCFYYENIEGGHGGAADAKQSAFMTSLAYDFMWEKCSGSQKEE